MSSYFSGIVVCVGKYSALLARSIDRWKSGCDRLLVVTAPHDRETLDLCGRAGVEVHATDVFYANGASFNKGAAMSEAELVHGLRAKNPDGWIVGFDADIVPPADWRKQIEHRLLPGCIHGSNRWELPEDAKELIIPQRQGPMPQAWVIGFFTVFQAGDPVLEPGKPVWAIDYPTAGMFDTKLTMKWHPVHRKFIRDLKMIHLGRERENWCGTEPEQIELTRKFLKDPKWYERRIAAPAIRTESV